MTINRAFSVRTSGWQKRLVWTIAISAVWLFFWYGSWQAFLHSSTWLRLGIGLAVFIIPGLCVYGLFVDHPNITVNHFSFGFVISHLIFAILGTLGRLTHLSFEEIKLVMGILGLLLLLLYLSRKFRYRIDLRRISLTVKRSIPILVLLLVSLTACLVVIQRVLTDDDLTYLAYITNWQHSTHLDFNDVIFGGPYLVHPRFWLVSAPFAQALLADVSNVSGISILSGYYEPFLVILSVLSWYGLARTFRLSPQVASISSMLQLSFLLLLSEYLHPGAPFFNQLSSDKATAAYILAPVFFQSLIRLLGRPTKNNTYLFLFAGLSLTFMHPIILAYSVFIGGMLVLFDQKNGGFQKKLPSIIILLVILLPQIALRFVSSQTSVNIPFKTEEIVNQRGIENIITRWADTSFYGLNLNTLSMRIPYSDNIPLPGPIMKWGWILLPVLSGVLAIRQFRENAISKFILSCFLLCLLAVIPFTGWIIGYFLSAWMLERAVWLFPFGLSTVYIISTIKSYSQPGQDVKALSLIDSFLSENLAVTATTILSIGLFLLYMHEKSLPDIEKFISKSQRYQDLAVAGQVLDHQISDQAFVIGSPNLNDLIPGLSWKSKLITFRIADPSNMSYYTPEERDERISDSKRIFSASLSSENKMRLIENQHIRFLFLQPFDLRLFNELIQSYPNRVKATEVGGVIIIRIYR